MMTVKRLKLKNGKKSKIIYKIQLLLNMKNQKKQKNNSNRVNAQAKRKHWSSFCNNEINDNKDMQKVWEKIKPSLPEF